MISPPRDPGIRNREKFFGNPCNELSVILRCSPLRGEPRRIGRKRRAEPPAGILRDAALRRRRQDDGTVCGDRVRERFSFRCVNNGAAGAGRDYPPAQTSNT